MRASEYLKRFLNREMSKEDIYDDLFHELFDRIENSVGKKFSKRLNEAACREINDRYLSLCKLDKSKTFKENEFYEWIKTSHNEYGKYFPQEIQLEKEKRVDDAWETVLHVLRNPNTSATRKMNNSDIRVHADLNTINSDSLESEMLGLSEWIIRMTECKFPITYVSGALKNAYILRKWIKNGIIDRSDIRTISIDSVEKEVLIDEIHTKSESTTRD